jgi:hypothetical protein
MRKSELLALYEKDQRIEVEYPGLQREVTPDVVRHIATTEPGEGIITFSRLPEANEEDGIRQQVSFFESIGQDFEWKVYDYDRPADLKERLESIGFAVDEAEALVVLDLDEAPAVLWQPAHQDVRRITDPARLVDVQTVERKVWGEDVSWVIPYLSGALRDYPEQMSVYVAYVNDQPASAAWIYFQDRSQFASLWGGATIRDFRRQGLYTALLAVRAQEARARQVRFLTVDASPMSRPILEQSGFRLLAYSYPCKWQTGSEKNEAVARPAAGPE